MRRAGTPTAAAHRRARRGHARGRLRHQRRAAAAVALLALAAVGVWVLDSGAPHRAPRAARAAVRVHATRARRATPSTALAVPHRPVAPAPGALPQTHADPSARSAFFKRLMADLWDGIARGSLRPALAAFFPRAAYVQLKEVPAAASDWENRLVRDFELDIGAAHALLGPGAARARLLAVHVNSAYGHWVPPGVCANGVGYYEMPGARLVYREGGATRSFGIASMISWRGEWYVVHLGAVLRSGEGGVVDEPAAGAGTPAYSGTC